MKISRFAGTTNQTIAVFIQDATVSTGAGLANIVASSVSFGYHREGMSAVSTGTCTTGTLGTYGASSFVQKSSTNMLGWYEFSPPNNLFAAGGYATLHMYGAPSMAPLPIEIDLSTQVAAINTPVGVSTVTIPVGVSTGTVGVSSASIPFGVSSGSIGVSSASIPFGVSTGSIGVSSATIPFGVSTGTVGVSSASIPFGVSGITVGERAALVDKLLGRNVAGGSDGGRTVSEALYVLRNKVDANLGIVYATDDTTSSWAFTVSTVAGNPIQVIDPA